MVFSQKTAKRVHDIVQPLRKDILFSEAYQTRFFVSMRFHEARHYDSVQLLYFIIVNSIYDLNCLLICNNVALYISCKLATF